jgi:hypothetical protein
MGGKRSTIAKCITHIKFCSGDPMKGATFEDTWGLKVGTGFSGLL